MEIVIRRAVAEDLDKVVEVESKATKNLRYLASVFDMFLNDREGEFSVACIDGEVVACGKYTVVPDGSAWLEALRVTPERQGLGIGKRFYDRFFELSRQKGINTMRMYTGVTNAVSKGLAERYGFRVAGTYQEATNTSLDVPDEARVPSFVQVTDPERATELLMPYASEWAGFLVMNRTYYEFTPPICRALCERGEVYEEIETGSVIALGARFMGDQAQHIGAFGGDRQACLSFALSKTRAMKAGRLVCQYPPSAAAVGSALMESGFRVMGTDLIVMEVRLGG